MTRWPLSEGPDAPLLGAFSAGLLIQAPPRVAVAVSGGGDSMALLHMALRAPFGWQVTALTVDHGLRPESAPEAAEVAAYCGAAGIPHHILPWEGPLPSGNLMDQARQARFALIAKSAQARGIGHVLLGHTADDNAESFLMNLARQAGIDGLCGMRTDWHDQGIVWHRPLLSLTRADLRAYLTRNGVPWIDDPSNDNPRFTRVKARRALAALHPLGITVDRLASTIANLADAQAALNLATANIAAAAAISTSGTLILPDQTLAPLDHETARRLLSSIIRWMNGLGYAPRGAQLFGLQMALHQGRPCQLGGVRFRLVKGDWQISRESRAVQGAVPFGQIWDHRWQGVGPADPSLEIRALGAAGLALCPDWRAHGRREALLVSPSIWAKDRLIAAPFAGISGEYHVELTQGLAEFILSH